MTLTLIPTDQDDPWAHAPEVNDDFVYEYDEIEFPDDLTEYPESEPF